MNWLHGKGKGFDETGKSTLKVSELDIAQIDRLDNMLSHGRQLRSESLQPDPKSMDRQSAVRSPPFAG